MPIHKTKSGGYKWGKTGKVYKTRAGGYEWRYKQKNY
jgi:hypothetical protein